MSKELKNPPFWVTKRRIKTFYYFFKNLSKTKSIIKNLVSEVYHYGSPNNQRIEKTILDRAFPIETSLEVSCSDKREGNTSYKELLGLCQICRHLNPMTVLEIGTFNGLSTLNMSLNTQESTRIYTLDLPSQQLGELYHFDDLKYIIDTDKKTKVYEPYNPKSKITQIYGDSLSCDFSMLSQERSYDLIFIDGGHNYECIKNDTEKAMKVLSAKGMILWHDYTPNCYGVYKYLNELSKNFSLFQIEGTSYVYYRRD